MRNRFKLEAMGSASGETSGSRSTSPVTRSAAKSMSKPGPSKLRQSIEHENEDEDEIDIPPTVAESTEGGTTESSSSDDQTASDLGESDEEGGKSEVNVSTASAEKTPGQKQLRNVISTIKSHPDRVSSNSNQHYIQNGALTLIARNTQRSAKLKLWKSGDGDGDASKPDQWALYDPKVLPHIDEVNYHDANGVYGFPANVILGERAIAALLNTGIGTRQRKKRWPANFDQGTITEKHAHRGRPLYAPGTNHTLLAISWHGGTYVFSGNLDQAAINACNTYSFTQKRNAEKPDLFVVKAIHGTNTRPPTTPTAPDQGSSAKKRRLSKDEPNTAIKHEDAKERESTEKRSSTENRRPNDKARSMSGSGSGSGSARKKTRMSNEGLTVAELIERGRKEREAARTSPTPESKQRRKNTPTVESLQKQLAALQLDYNALEEKHNSAEQTALNNLKSSLTLCGIGARTKQELDVAIAEGRKVAGAANDAAAHIFLAQEALADNNHDAVKSSLENAINVLKVDGYDNYIGELANTELARCESWSRWGATDVLDAIQYPTAAFKLNGSFIDASSYAFNISKGNTNFDLDTMGLEERKEESGETRAGHRGAKGPPRGGHIFTYNLKDGDDLYATHKEELV